MTKSELCDRNYIAILVCDDIPNQKFWDAKAEDWTSDIEKATTYHKYIDVARAIWLGPIPEDKITHRVTTCPKAIYLRLLAGENI